MPQNPNIELKGYMTFPNVLALPSGALSVAENIAIQSPNECWSRRGHGKYGDQIVLAGGERITEIWDFSDRLLVRNGDRISYDSDGLGTWVDYSGAYNAEDSENGVLGLRGNQAFYVNTNMGVKKLAELTGSFSLAGAPEALDCSAVVTNASSLIYWLANNGAVAYRIVWKRKDVNGVVELGAPSGRTEVYNNSGGGRAVDITLTIPAEITTADFCQIYRSIATTSLSVTPGDDLYLAKEVQPTSGEITSGYMTVTDETDETALGTALYTNQTQEGILNSNFRPPVAAEMCAYNGCFCYGRTRQPQRVLLSLVQIGGVGGMALNDTITIAGLTFTAKGAENIASAQFLLDTTSSTMAKQIKNTLNSLVKVVNRYSGNTLIYAYYSGEYGVDAGAVRFEARSWSASVFSVIGQHSGGGSTQAWAPALPVSGIAVSSDNDAGSNRVYFSKNGIPGAVPISSYISVGDTSERIEAMIAGRLSLFVFTNERKIWRISGTDPETVQVEQFDNTIQIYGPRTLINGDTQLYYFTTAGVHANNESGTEETGFLIHDTLDQYLDSASWPNFKSHSFGLAYESDHQYLFSTEDKIYVYNWLMKAWSYWEKEYTAGLVHSTEDRLYFGDSTGWIWQERKANTRFDYADEDFTANVVSKSNYDVVLNSVTNAVVGRALWQSDTIWAYITAVDIGTNTVTVDEILGWAIAGAKIFSPITCQVKLQPQHFGAPGTMKRHYEVVFHWQEIYNGYSALIANNFRKDAQEIEIVPAFVTGAWGDGYWGEYPWGGEASGEQNNRLTIPIDFQRALWLTLGVKSAVPFQPFKFNGMTVKYESVGSRFVENAQ